MSLHRTRSRGDWSGRDYESEGIDFHTLTRLSCRGLSKSLLQGARLPRRAAGQQPTRGTSSRIPLKPECLSKFLECLTISPRWLGMYLKMLTTCQFVLWGFGVQESAYKLTILFTATLLASHLFAMLWIELGLHYEDGWINKLKEQNYDGVWASYGPYELYTFSLYWICTVLTTVGYGDFSGTNEREYLYSIFLEFAGLLLFSILTGLLIQFITVKQNFESMCSNYLENCNKWIMKMERANDSKGETYMPSEMYRTIITFTEAAFRHDHNLIIEEANFYYQLKPRDQTYLIRQLFSEFRREFKFFFDPCEQGFVNECIINLATRRWVRDSGCKSQMVHKNGIKVQDLFFCVRGGFGLFHKLAREDPRRPLPPFALIASGKTYGDYQILFDLYPNFDFRTYVTDHRHANAEKYLTRSDLESNQYIVMTFAAERFNKLCQLYPRTRLSLQYRAIDRRNFFLKVMQEQEREYGIGKSMNNGLRDPSIQLLEDEHTFTDIVPDYSKIKVLKAETDAYGRRNQDEKHMYGNMKRALKEARIMKKEVKRIVEEFKEGSLVRTRTTRTKLEKGFLQDITTVDCLGTEDEANYLEFAEAVEEQTLGTSRLSDSMRPSRAEMTQTDVGQQERYILRVQDV